MPQTRDEYYGGGQAYASLDAAQAAAGDGPVYRVRRKRRRVIDAGRLTPGGNWHRVATEPFARVPEVAR